MEIVTRDEQETIDFAEKFAKLLVPGDIVLLSGELGAGKSVFCRAVIRALCCDKGLEVPSPTYTLVQIYEGNKGSIWHFDLYRLSDPSEIYEIGWEEALGQGIVLVEWPERLGAHLPDRAINVRLSTFQGNSNHRKIEISGYDNQRFFSP